MKKCIVIAAMAGMMTLSVGWNAYAGQWIQTGDVWRYLREDGSLQAGGWQWIDGKCYYFDETGNMLAGADTPDGYQVDGSGAWVVDGVVQTETKDQRRMASMKYASDSSDRDEDEYSNAGPGYDSSRSAGSSGTSKRDTSQASETESGWEEDDGEWKYSSGDRYVTNDWKKIDGEWYYFDEDGIMVTGFQTIQRSDYYFKSSGALQMNSFTLDDVRYTVNEDGAITGEKEVDKESGSSSSGPSTKYVSNSGTVFSKETPEDDGSVKQTEFEYSYDERNRRSYEDEDEDDYEDEDEDVEDDEDDEDDEE